MRPGPGAAVGAGTTTVVPQQVARVYTRATREPCRPVVPRCSS